MTAIIASLTVAQSMIESRLLHAISGGWRRTSAFRLRSQLYVSPSYLEKNEYLGAKQMDCLGKPACFWIRRRESAQSITPGRSSAVSFLPPHAALITT